MGLIASPYEAIMGAIRFARNRRVGDEPVATANLFSALVPGNRHRPCSPYIPTINRLTRAASGTERRSRRLPSPAFRGLEPVGDGGFEVAPVFALARHVL
jgi:hypothetical protein